MLSRAALLCVLSLVLLQPSDAAKKQLYTAEPSPGTTDAIDVTAYLKKAGDFHFVVLQAGQPEPTAFNIKAAKQGTVGVAAAQTIEVRKPGRVSHRVAGLGAGTKYDLYFVAEAQGSNGVFGAVKAVKDITTFQKAPALTEFKAKAGSGSTSKVLISFKLSAEGDVHYLFLTSGYESPKSGANVKGALLSSSVVQKGTARVNSSGIVFTEEVDGLQADTQYDLYLTTETSGSGVYGTVSHAVSIRTHGDAPAIDSAAVRARDGAVDAVTLSLEVDKSCNLFYTILKAGSLAPKEPQSIVEAKTGAISTGQRQISVSGAASVLISENVTEGLAAGTAYDVYMVTETLGSDGVYSDVSEKMSVTTHTAAPALSTVSVRAKDASSDALTLSFTLSGAGEMHYVVLASDTKTAAPSTGAAVMALGSSGAVTSGRMSVETASANKKLEVAIDASLSAGSEYQVFVVAETTGSGGVYSVVNPKITSATHAAAPTVTALSAAPTDGSTKALALECKSDATGTLHYALLAADKSAGVAAQITDPDELKAAKGAVASGSFDLDGADASAVQTFAIEKGLQPGASYQLFVVSETTGSNGVYGSVSQPIDVTTHSSAPTVVESSAVATNASSSALDLSATFARPGVLHYVVLAASANTATPKDGAALKAITTAAAAGSVDLEDKPGAVSVDGLIAGTSYDVFMVSETKGSGGVFGSVSRKLSVSTHATPPSLTGVTATPKSGSASAIMLQFQAASAALVHYVFMPAGNGDDAPQSGTLLPETCAKERVVCGTASLMSANQLQSHKVAELEAGTGYDIYVVAETVDSHGVFGRISPKTAASTFPLAPRFAESSLRALPSNASSTAVSISFQLETAALVHYVVLAEGAPPPPSAQSVVKASGAKATGKFELEAAAAGAMQQILMEKGLAAGTAYDVYMVTETLGSDGVYSDVSEKMSVTTHTAAPALSTVSVRAKDASSDALTLSFTLSSAGEMHYVVLASDTKTAAPSTGAAVMALGSSGAVTSGRVSVEEANSKRVIETEISTGLQGGTSYDIYCVSETTGSHGVYGTVYSKMVATTHAVAPDVTVTVSASGAAPTASSVRPVAGSTGSVQVSYKIASACVVHYAVLDEGSAAPASGADVVRETDKGAGRAAVGSVALKDTTPGSVANLIIDGLHPGSPYDVYLVAETDKSAGVYGAITPKLAVRTHSEPPLLVVKATTAKPTDGATTEVDLFYEVKAPPSEGGVLHYVVLAASANTATPKDGAALKAITTAAAAGSVDLEDKPGAVSVDGLIAGTSYDVFMVSETKGSGGVFGSVSRKLSVSTHVPAPTLSSHSAAPLAGSTTALLLTAELQGSGLVHYALQPVPPTSAAQIASSNGGSDLAPMQTVRGHWAVTMSAKAAGAGAGAVAPLSSNHTVEGLAPGCEYQVFLVTETHASGGVFGAPTPPTAARTHARAPAFVPSLTNVSGAEGDATSLTLHAALSAPGTAYYAVCAPGMALSAEDVWKAATAGIAGPCNNSGAIEVSGAAAATETVTGLSPGSEYSVFLAGETSGSKGVLGDLLALPPTHTWAVSPSLLESEVSVSPVIGSATEVRISFAPVSGAADRIAAPSKSSKSSMEEKFHVHYAVTAVTGSASVADAATVGDAMLALEKAARASAKGAKGAAAAGAAKKPALPSGVLHAGTLAASEGAGVDAHARSAVVRGLSAGQSYAVTMVTETVGSHVYSEAVTVEVATNVVPPGFASARVEALQGSTDALDISYTLQASAAAASSMSKIHYACWLHDLSESQLVQSQSESAAGSAGAGAAFGAESASVVMAEGAATKGSVLTDAVKGAFNVSGLEAGASYRVLLVVESLQNAGAATATAANGSGVFSGTASAHFASTHRTVPVVTSASVAAKPASTGVLALRYQLAGAGFLHYVVVDAPKDAPKDAAKARAGAGAGAVPTNASDLKALATAKGAATDAPAEKGTLTITKAMDEPAIKSIPKLQPGASYVIAAVVESEEGSGVFGNVFTVGSVGIDASVASGTTPSIVSTFGDAPALISHKVLPVSGTVDSIQISADLSAPGVLHYSVLVSAAAKPSALAIAMRSTGRQLELGGRVVHRGSISVDVHKSREAADDTTSEDESLSAHVSIDGLQAGASYDVLLVTEVEGSDGVFGRVSPPATVTTFAAAPEITSSSSAPTDGSAEGVTLAFAMKQAGVVHYALVAFGEGPVVGVDDGATFPTLNATANGPVFAVGSREITEAMVGKAAEVAVANLSSATKFDTYFVAETAGSGGVFGAVLGPVAVTTHSPPPDESEEEVDCSHAPDCAALHRDDCWLVADTCGECLPGYHGAEGAANSECEAGASAQKKAAEEQARREAEEEALAQRKAEKEAEEEAKRRAAAERKSKLAAEQKEAARIAAAAAAKAKDAVGEQKKAKQKAEAATAAAAAEKQAAAKKNAMLAAAAARAKATAGKATGAVAAAKQAAEKQAAEKQAAEKQAAEKQAAETRAATMAATAAKAGAAKAAARMAAAKQAAKAAAEQANAEEEDALDLSDDAEEEDDIARRAEEMTKTALMAEKKTAAEAEAKQKDSANDALEKRAQELEQAAMDQAKQEASAKSAKSSVAARIEAAKAAARRQYNQAAAQAAG